MDTIRLIYAIISSAVLLTCHIVQADYVIRDDLCGNRLNPLTIQPTLSSENFYSHSPSDSYYPTRMHCYTRFEAPPGYKITLTFTDFSLSSYTAKGGCTDYVLIYDSANVNYGRLMVPATGICGHNLPSPVTYRSSSNFIILEFYTDSIPDRRYGFRVRYARYQYYSVNNDETHSCITCTGVGKMGPLGCPAFGFSRTGSTYTVTSSCVACSKKWVISTQSVTRSCHYTLASLHEEVRALSSRAQIQREREGVIDWRVRQGIEGTTDNGCVNYTVSKRVVVEYCICNSGNCNAAYRPSSDLSLTVMVTFACLWQLSQQKYITIN